MKSCPNCRRLYPDDAGFCPVDGVALLSASRVPVETSERDGRIGTLLCMRYQLRRVIADGGAGRVYEALDTHERKRVAVKVLHPEVAASEVAVLRFERELEVSKQVAHDHVVLVHDFVAIEGGGYALVMEFLDGEELRAVLKKDGRIPPARLVRMLSQVALALDGAHERSLVHRDLKPDNLFLCGTREGDIVKVLDFGSVRDNSSGAKKLTMMGTTIGSPYYMAPEQAQGLDTLDARADVWALAAVAYECLTGEVPFSGRTGPAILLSILTSHPIPPSMRAPQIPVAVDDVMERGFAKDPSQRTSTASELADAIGHAFGLEGDHRAWAYTPQDELERRISSRLPALLAATPRTEPVPASQAIDADDSPLAAGLPRPAPSWLLPAVIGGVSLAAGLAVAWLFTR